MRFIAAFLLVALLAIPSVPCRAGVFNPWPLLDRAEKGDVQAQSELGNVYLRGEGGPQDPEKAAKWVRMAADAGDARAQDNLSLMYREGLGGLPQDQEKSVAWMKKAAEQGYARAQYKLALAYRDGAGIAESETRYMEWLRKAAKGGNAAAQYILGQEYHKAKDFSEAAKWHRKAAQQGHPAAQDAIGNFYSKGRGVAQDFAEAAKWYREAAEHPEGYKARRKLADFYRKGLGVEEDDGQAYFWLLVSLGANLEAGNFASREIMDLRRRFESRLSARQVAEAMTVALAWLETHGPLPLPRPGAFREDPAGSVFKDLATVEADAGNGRGKKQLIIFALGIALFYALARLGLFSLRRMRRAGKEP